MTKADKPRQHCAARKRHILVVSDSLKISSRLRETLTAESYRVVFTENGLDALSRVRSRPFDIIITRLRMPAMDGLELIMNLRDLRVRTPVLIIEEGEGRAPDTALINVVGYCCNPPIQEEIIDIAGSICSHRP